MKVYVLTKGLYGRQAILGVFAREDHAIAVYELLLKHCDPSDIGVDDYEVISFLTDQMADQMVQKILDSDLWQYNN